MTSMGLPTFRHVVLGLVIIEELSRGHHHVSGTTMTITCGSPCLMISANSSSHLPSCMRAISRLAVRVSFLLKVVSLKVSHVSKSCILCWSSVTPFWYATSERESALVSKSSLLMERSSCSTTAIRILSGHFSASPLSVIGSSSDHARVILTVQHVPSGEVCSCSMYFSPQIVINSSGVAVSIVF